MGELRRRGEFDGKMEVLPRVCLFVEAACMEAGVLPDARFDLELAVEEACANIIEHAYAGTGGTFSIEFATRGADVVITLQDRGQAFDPTAIEAPDLNASGEERRVGGMGLHLMKTLMDQVEFSFDDHGNLLRMVKHDVAAVRRNA